MVNFTAHRRASELVAPALPTPRDTKALSDIDDFSDLRSYISIIEFFRPVRLHPSMVDPAKAIKAALKEALLYYYPIAGRLRETPGGRLVVDCTGEGVVFVVADADVALEEFGQPLLPPYPCVEELLCNAIEHTGVVGKPLAYIQVTRLKHGAFVIGMHMCHNITDGFGVGQFVRTITELARGEAHPTVMPVFEREIFKARTPPRIRRDIYPGDGPFLNGSFIRTDDVMLSTPPENMVGQLFNFGPKEIATLRRHVPAKSYTTFELLTAFVWRCRTVALGYEVGQCVRLIFYVNARWIRKLNPPVPKGYYGNAALCPMIEASVDDLCGKPLGHTLELVQRAKLYTTEEHMRSTVDMAAALRTHPYPPYLAVDRAYYVSDISRLGQNEFDFGWAKRAGGGLAKIGITSNHMAYKNDTTGEETIAVSMLLPRPAMERFAEEISMWISKDGNKILPISSM